MISVYGISVFHCLCVCVCVCRVLAGFADSQVTTEARYAWKYAASRGITGTPQFIVNGVHVPTAADFTAPEWEKLIGGLLAEPWGVRHR